MEIFEGSIKQCYGCKACEQICPKKAISMQYNEDGFNYPIIHAQLCIECGLCRKVCPVNFTVALKRERTPEIYAGWILDKTIHKKSTSGGLFTALATEILKHDGVIFGAAWHSNLNVGHMGVNNEADLARLRGSKYIQSDIGKTYIEAKEWLKQKKNVLFTGTPCQIAGLYGFLGKDNENLLTCEVVCHGVPSQLAFNKYRQKFDGLRDKGVVAFSFRDTEIWNYQTKYWLGEKEKCLFGEKDFYMKAFFKCLLFRESCYTCRFARLPRAADITIGDFWGIGKKVPFKKDPRGVSFVLVNSTKGREWIDRCSDKLFLEKRSLEEAIRQNRNIVEPTVRPENRNSFYSDLDLPLQQLVVKYELKPTWRNYMGYLKRKMLHLYVWMCK